MVEQVAKKKRGRPRKPIEQHIAEGTYRPDRYGPLVSDKLDYPVKPTGAITATIQSQSKWITGPHLEYAVSKGARFNEALAEHAAVFFPKFLRHSKDRWYGLPFDLLDWQRDDVIYPLFGWVRPDGRRLFRRVYIEIPKKNGKSTLASGIGLYMLCCDLIGGSEVYSAAADREQASIVHKQAINMVDASDELSSVLKVNRSTFNIQYKGTKSWYRALSAAPGSKEGLDIHCAIIDELHIWKGRALWDTLKYGYRARSQPLQFVITTAGSDPQSICWEQHQHAREVLAGKVTDINFYPLIYSAETGDDWRDPEVWEEANPSYGDIITRETLEEDCKEAEGSESSISVFKRYTLNIWSTGATAWLKMDSWEKCRRDFTEQDLEGESCHLALDMSRTRDLSALAANFPQADGTHDLLTWFWLAEGSLKYYNRIEGLYDWVKQGLINIIPGEVIEPSFIKEAIVGLKERFDILDLVYDPMFAEPVCQEIEEEAHITRVVFRQRLMNFAAPTEEFERLVLAEKVHHNNNLVLNWQAGNTEVYTDINGNKRPIKPKGGDHRRIDGIVAHIMATSQCMIPPVVSRYVGTDKELQFI